ncbi:MAG: DUF362 domain-containing protein [Candidatus Zipacnadales bacterium]
MDRRRFLQTSGTLAARALGSSLAVPQTERRSRIAAMHSAAVQPVARKLNRDIVLKLLDRGICHTTGIDTADKAWQSLFASDDVVAIKVNSSAGPSLSTSKVLVEALLERLAEVGIPPDQMAIYDRTDGMLAAAGFELNTGKGVKCGGVEGHWDPKVVRQGVFQGQLPVILNYCSAIVNVPILKDAPGAGITISMKNHFGTISNPSQCHGNGCDPYIADVNALPAIRNKQRLIICDATTACYEGGPAADPRYIWHPNTLLIGTDCVALDTIGLMIIDEKRVQQGLPTLAAVGRNPKQLASAAARGLGTNELDKIDLLKQSL